MYINGENYVLDNSKWSWCNCNDFATATELSIDASSVKIKFEMYDDVRDIPVRGLK